MADDKNPILNSLEQSLIQYLSQKPEVDKKVAGGYRRVRSLTINIDESNPNKPLFAVRIGMFECVFDCTTGLKEKGSCYGIERLIIDWYSRPSVQAEMKNVITTRPNIKKLQTEKES